MFIKDASRSEATRANGAGCRGPASEPVGQVRQPSTMLRLPEPCRGAGAKPLRLMKTVKPSGLIRAGFDPLDLLADQSFGRIDDDPSHEVVGHPHKHAPHGVFD